MRIGIYNECWQLPGLDWVDALAETFVVPDSQLAISPLSGNEEVRRLNGKHYSNERLLQFLEALERHRLPIFVFFSLNLPGETEATLSARSLWRARSCAPIRAELVTIANMHPHHRPRVGFRGRPGSIRDRGPDADLHALLRVRLPDAVRSPGGEGRASARIRDEANRVALTCAHGRDVGRGRDRARPELQAGPISLVTGGTVMSRLPDPAPLRPGRADRRGAPSPGGLHVAPPPTATAPPTPTEAPKPAAAPADSRAGRRTDDRAGRHDRTDRRRGRAGGRDRGRRHGADQPPDQAGRRCSAAAPGQGARDHVAMDADPVSFDCHVQTNFSSAQGSEHFYESLTAFDDKLNIVPGLAASWEQAKDGLS